MKCEKKVAAICKKYGIRYRMETLKFGFKRAVIEFDSYALLEGIRDELQGIKGTVIHSFVHFQGEFSGALTVMDENDDADLHKKLREEHDRIEDWWRRYNAADEETRRLMACGAIA